MARLPEQSICLHCRDGNQASGEPLAVNTTARKLGPKKSSSARYRKPPPRATTRCAREP